jgi:ABC-type lipoprotein export system ATPase subunit
MSAEPVADGEVVIDARNVWKSFDGGKIPVVQGVDLQVRRGEMVALWGVSGSGKSTLLHLISALDAPDRGTISILGRDPAKESVRLELRRRHVGFVFQLHNLIPDLTLEENLNIPATAAGRNRAWARERIASLAEGVGLGHRLRHRIQDLSGGERQRTAICRALINQPELVFADEPTGSLDEETGAAVFDLLWQMVAREGVTVVLATHERRFMERCTRALRIQHGKAIPYDPAP